MSALAGAAQSARPAATRTPSVVALVPTWKAAGFIDQTLDALAAQSWRNFRILISDDASPDETAAICERRAARDPRVRVIRQSVNLGWVRNANALLAEARGDYLCFAFQDDLPATRYVERCVAALEADAEAVLAFSDITLVHQDGRRETRVYDRVDGEIDRRERARRIALQRGDWWIPNRGVFRAPAASAIGGLRRHGAGEFSADWPWLLEMSLLGRFTRVPEILCTKIYQARSLSRTWSFDLRSWSAVTLSAARGVARAAIPASDKARLLATLGRFLWRRAMSAARQGPERADRPEPERRRDHRKRGTSEIVAGSRQRPLGDAALDPPDPERGS